MSTKLLTVRDDLSLSNRVAANGKLGSMEIGKLYQKKKGKVSSTGILMTPACAPLPKLTERLFRKLVEPVLGTALDDPSIRGSDKKLKLVRDMIPTILGVQQWGMKIRTGFTSLTTTATPNLVQVVNMDVTGASIWTSLANIADEYRVKRATLHVIPQYSRFGAAATALSAMPIIVVVDYDDSTALASSSAAITYDSSKLFSYGSEVVHKITAHPLGQPDMAWVTTATPVVPFWFKFWSVSTLIPNNAAIGFCYIEMDLEFRQVA